MARLLEQYNNEIRPALGEALKIKNDMAIPRLQKVVISMGVGLSLQDKARMPSAIASLTQISGQKPVIRKARKSVSNFKLRTGYEVGCMVTLRGKRMFEFVDRLINATIPRLRDFRGLNPRSFDGRGNYSMGLSDESVFSEIDQDKTGRPQGMNITFVTSAVDDAGGREMLRMMGMPFRKTEEQKD